jgi:hypothetical protein
MAMRLGTAAFVFLSASVNTPSSNSALMLSWSILLDRVNARAPCPIA